MRAPEPDLAAAGRLACAFREAAEFMAGLTPGLRTGVAARAGVRWAGEAFLAAAASWPGFCRGAGTVLEAVPLGRPPAEGDPCDWPFGMTLALAPPFFGRRPDAPFGPVTPGRPAERGVVDAPP